MRRIIALVFTAAFVVSCSDDDSGGSGPAGPVDDDGDGYTDAIDCDDSNPDVYPDAPDTCGDGVDSDCDGEDPACACRDSDGDGQLAITCGGTDCDDSDPDTFPGAPDACGDGIDQDCNGADAICECADVDSDGQADAACGGTDCDDGDPSVYTGATEVCGDGVDQDCSGDDLACECADADADGFDDLTCGGTDCDDENPAIYPGAVENCDDGVNQNCDAVNLACDCVDDDEDGFLSAACGGDDCNDLNETTYPGALDICGDETDNDCDGSDPACGACSDGTVPPTGCLCGDTPVLDGYCCGGAPQSDLCDDVPVCAAGAVEFECLCDGSAVQTGYCCDDVWFDPYYETLTGGCPTSPYFYVNPSHDDADDSNDGTADAPWETLLHAVATLQAGETVVVRPATYAQPPKNLRFDPVFNPAHSGEPGSPIVIKGTGRPVLQPAVSESGTAQSGAADAIQLASEASTDDDAYVRWYVRITSGTGAGQYRPIIGYAGDTRLATVEFDWDTAPDATSEYALTTPGPLVGTLTRHDVVWDGFDIIEIDNYHRDTGPAVIWDSDDVTFMNNEIVGQPVGIVNNHNGLRIEGSARAVVRNNVIRDVAGFDVGENNPQNHAAVMIYTSTDCVFEHNHIVDSYSGFFPKGGDSGHVFRYNVVEGCAKAFRVSYHDDVDIHQNAIVASEIALQPAEEITAIRFFNNVVYGCDTGVNNWFAFDNVDVFNNIFASTPFPFHMEGASGTFLSDNNDFFDYTDFVVDNGNVGGLSAWRDTGHDLASVEVNPEFEDVAAHDFHLPADSALSTAGIDRSDLDGDGDTAEAVPVGLYVSGDEVIGLLRPLR